jgi:hypothetical protein
MYRYTGFGILAVISSRTFIELGYLCHVLVEIVDPVDNRVVESGCVFEVWKQIESMRKAGIDLSFHRNTILVSRFDTSLKYSSLTRLS